MGLSGFVGVFIKCRLSWAWCRQQRKATVERNERKKVKQRSRWRRERRFKTKLNQPARSWSICVRICLVGPWQVSLLFCRNPSKNTKREKQIISGENCNIKAFDQREHKVLWLARWLHLPRPRPGREKGECMRCAHYRLLRLNFAAGWHWAPIKLNARIGFVKQWGSS